MSYVFTFILYINQRYLPVMTKMAKFLSWNLILPETQKYLSNDMPFHSNYSG